MSAMRIPLAVTIIAIAMLASPHAYGQAGKGQIGTQGTSGKPSGPAVGGGDRTLIPPTQPAVAAPSDALSNLAGGGYADPNYVPPGERSKKSTRHRVVRAPMRAPHVALSNTAAIRPSHLDTIAAVAIISAARRGRAHPQAFFLAQPPSAGPCKSV